MPYSTYTVDDTIAYIFSERPSHPSKASTSSPPSQLLCGPSLSTSALELRRRHLDSPQTTASSTFQTDHDSNSSHVPADEARPNVPGPGPDPGPGCFGHHTYSELLLLPICLPVSPDSARCDSVDAASAQAQAK